MIQVTAELPSDVQLYIRHLQKIPSPITRELSNSIPVLAFIKIHFPDIRNGLVSPKPMIWFSAKKINSVPAGLMDIPSIPPKHIVKAPRATIDQAIINGQESVIDPSNPMQCLPFYTRWRDSVDWLQRETSGNNQDVAMTLAILQVFPANQSLSSLDLTYAPSNANTSDLSRMLGERWLNSGLIDILLGLVSDRIENDDDDLDSRVVVESLRMMEPLVKQIKDTKQKPAAEHWIALKIVLHGEGSPSLEYVDGIDDNPRPENILSRLKGWLERHFQAKFFARGNTLAHGLAQTLFTKMGINIPEPTAPQKAIKIDDLLNESPDTEIPVQKNSMQIDNLLNPANEGKKIIFPQNKLSIVSLLNSSEPLSMDVDIPTSLSVLSSTKRSIASVEEPDEITTRKLLSGIESESDTDEPLPPTIYESDSLSESTVNTNDKFYHASHTASEDEENASQQSLPLSSSLITKLPRSMGVAKSSVWACNQNKLWAAEASWFSQEEGACDDCVALLRLCQFHRAIKRPILDAYNFRFLPKEYRNESLAQIYARSKGLEEIFNCKNPNDTPCLNYALTVLKGEHVNSKQNNFFGDFLKALNILHEKEVWGASTQGMKMPPLLAQLAETIEMMSPQTYRVLKE
ncbi:hypothetical protein F5050DRAFT_1813121 [Lentinula boryana]|uniref:Uncharacterized protein n=1 Tax=Lentinula boryana TaxID=40481 RepID=A0ABQ8PXP6_9AGAR|nr:hypothetical protein F5050DRAFT_1813121 [Lentinula boryana]